jgi:hypothetical protein
VTGVVSFTIDLTAHEGTRLAAVLEALGSDWDPIEVVTGEVQAHRMLYANLNPDQQAAHDLLVAAGVLTDIREVTT